MRVIAIAVSSRGDRLIFEIPLDTERTDDSILKAARDRYPSIRWSHVERVVEANGRDAATLMPSRSNAWSGSGY